MPEDDAPLCDVGHSFCGGLCNVGAGSISVSFSTNGLNCVNRDRFKVRMGLSVSITTAVVLAQILDLLPPFIRLFPDA